MEIFLNLITRLMILVVVLCGRHFDLYQYLSL